jgi:hypothetical protein
MSEDTPFEKAGADAGKALVDTPMDTTAAAVVTGGDAVVGGVATGVEPTETAVLGTAGTTGAAVGTAVNAVELKPVGTVGGAVLTGEAGVGTGVGTAAVAVEDADMVAGTAVVDAVRTAVNVIPHTHKKK